MRGGSRGEFATPSRLGFHGAVSLDAELIGVTMFAVFLWRRVWACLVHRGRKVYTSMMIPLVSGLHARLAQYATGVQAFVGWWVP